MGQNHISILHARLRNNCSNLNNDLFRNHLRDNPWPTSNRTKVPTIVIT